MSLLYQGLKNRETHRNSLELNFPITRFSEVSQSIQEATNHLLLNFSKTNSNSWSYRGSSTGSRLLRYLSDIEYNIALPVFLLQGKCYHLHHQHKSHLAFGHIRFVVHLIPMFTFKCFEKLTSPSFLRIKKNPKDCEALCFNVSQNQVSFLGKKKDPFPY